MKCEVETFEQGLELTIKDWIDRIETHFRIGQVPSKSFVPFMMMKIYARHLNKIKEHKSLDYLPFREKLLEVFQEPHLATADLNALSSISQARDESISDYMHRARLLVVKAYRDLAHGARERILITSFLSGLADRQLVASLAVAKISSSSDARNSQPKENPFAKSSAPEKRI